MVSNSQRLLQQSHNQHNAGRRCSWSSRHLGMAVWLQGCVTVEVAVSTRVECNNIVLTPILTCHSRHPKRTDCHTLIDDDEQVTSTLAMLRATQPQNEQRDLIGSISGGPLESRHPQAAWSLGGSSSTCLRKPEPHVLSQHQVLPIIAVIVYASQLCSLTALHQDHLDVTSSTMHAQITTHFCALLPQA